MLDLKAFCDSIGLQADGECRQVVKTSDCGSDMRGFESHHSPHYNKNYNDDYNKDRNHFLLFITI